jgi:hypothetical protein
MRAIVIASLSLFACGGASQPNVVAPTSPADKTETVEGPLVNLQLATISADGSMVVAWEGSLGIGESAPLCAIRIAPAKAVCVVPTKELPEGLPPRLANGFVVLDVSRTGRHVALQTPTSLELRDTATLNVVATVPLSSDGGLVHGAFAPNEERFAWLDEGSLDVLSVRGGPPKVVHLASRPRTKHRSVGSGVHWAANDIVLGWSDSVTPTAVDLRDDSQQAAFGDSIGLAGKHVAIRGDVGVIATDDGKVAFFDVKQVKAVRWLGHTVNGQKHVKRVFLSKRHVVIVRGDDRRSELDVLDLDDGRQASITTASIDAIGISADETTLAWTTWDPEKHFTSFTSPLEVPLLPGPGRSEAFLGWSGTNTVVHGGGGTCLRVGEHDAWCRDQAWAPYPDVTHRGPWSVVGGAHLLRLHDGDQRFTEIFVTGSVAQPIAHVREMK